MSNDQADHRAQITALIHRYPECIDAGDFEGVAQLFEHAVVRSGDHAFTGYDTLLDLWRGMVRLYDGGRPLTKHVVSNVVVDIHSDGTSAHARSYVTVLQAVPPDFPLQVIVSARHHDSFEQVDGVWRFTERIDITDLVGDLSRHTTSSYAAEAPAS